MTILCYCKRCGRIVQRDDLNKPCDYCQNTVHQIPDSFLIGDSKTAIDKNLKEQFINEYIKSSPEFDQYLFDHRDEDLFNQYMSDKAKLEHGAAITKEKSRKASCLYCGSSNIRKIGTFGRSLSVSIFGLGSSKIGKQWHCNHCGSDF